MVKDIEFGVTIIEGLKTTRKKIIGKAYSPEEYEQLKKERSKHG